MELANKYPEKYAILPQMQCYGGSDSQIQDILKKANERERHNSERITCSFLNAFLLKENNLGDFDHVLLKLTSTS